MTLTELEKRCYQVIDITDGYIQELQQIRNFQSNTLCTTLFLRPLL